MNTPKQPSFYRHAGDKPQGIPASDLDQLSDEEIRNLLNGVNAQAGKSARVFASEAPKAPREVDLSKILGGIDG